MTRPLNGIYSSLADHRWFIRICVLLVLSTVSLAGLRADDVVISLGGQAIANIYDYTYALDAVKIGEETTLGIIRQGQTMQMTITPQARP